MSAQDHSSNSRHTSTPSSGRATRDEHAPAESGRGEHSPPGGGWFGRTFPHARADLSASIVVFLVAVPLSLGIAVASGAPILAGLVAAVVGAVVAGLLGGSKLQVSGPAAGLTVIVAELVNTYGWQVTTLITAGAGVLQIVFGLTKLSRFAQAIPPAVVHGMLAGIGATIALGQLNVVLGDQAQTGGVASIGNLPSAVANLSWPALLLGGLVIAIMLGWSRLPSKITVVPAALVAIVAATAVSLAFTDVTRVELGGSLLDALSLPSLPESNWGGVLFGMLTVALIASVESLLSAVAIERMKPGTRTDTDRELLGQGAANTVSGMIGGLPITGVIVRSAANVKAGAETRASAVMHGVWIALFAIVLIGVIELIPMAALAGLLVMMGIGLIKPADIRTARAHGELAIYAVTLAGVVFLNLLEGVVIGLVLAGLMLLWRAVRSRPHLDQAADGSCELVIEGSLSFLAVPRLSRELNAVPHGADITVRLVTDYLDHAAYDHLLAWKARHEGTGGVVTVIEPDEARRSTTPGARFLTWGEWQSRDAEQTAAEPLMAGVAAYHENTCDAIRPTMSELAGGQSPSAMMISCADSRVLPHVITHSGPGDVFTVQNVGNLACGPGTAAAVEFATSALNVPLVAVCGHSGCGAMKGLRAGAAGSEGALGAWLLEARPVLRAFETGHPVAEAAARDGFDEIDQLAMVNVALQMEMLRAQESGAEVMGMFYDIRTARVLVLDEQAQRFVDVRPDADVPGSDLDRIAAGHGHGLAATATVRPVEV
ncbi:SulP family inorganic anion transporter [Pseudonocardia sp. HH130630-07]|uniref:SulP family inorganic anion transporter n=1 Tax=Pseudonocardia sp. HH130630-07 TaxID=1690815 RepID=UPI00081530B8|nr:bifunctional SulP family inorganic anion transporter/carbonic anhydrase [Pseudonocardia sp. HH130630-07]ANY05074.1 carbonic anhydrase [Pseudonocardia sp. HH130630-07]